MFFNAINFKYVGILCKNISDEILKACISYEAQESSKEDWPIRSESICSLNT